MEVYYIAMQRRDITAKGLDRLTYFSNDVKFFPAFPFHFTVITLSRSVMLFHENFSRHSRCNKHPMALISSTGQFGVKLRDFIIRRLCNASVAIATTEDLLALSAVDVAQLAYR